MADQESWLLLAMHIKGLYGMCEGTWVVPKTQEDSEAPNS